MAPHMGVKGLFFLDNYFLNGPWSVQILATIGRDVYNQKYPIAWDVISSESKEWFGAGK